MDERELLGGGWSPTPPDPWDPWDGIKRVREYEVNGVQVRDVWDGAGHIVRTFTPPPMLDMIDVTIGFAPPTTEPTER